MAPGGTLSAVQKYRRAKIKDLTNDIGVYALCDLDGVPIYVGQSIDGIQNRVRRHLTSARSDIIANRQVDPWEIAFVQAYPVATASEIPRLEAGLFAKLQSEKPLMNGSILKARGRPLERVPKPAEIVQILTNEEIRVRKDPSLRLPRQIEHIGRLVDHILTVKDSPQLRRSLAAHFDRLDVYRDAFLKPDRRVVRAAGEADEEEEA